MPAWLALCDLGAPGWGSPGFRTVLCCFLPHLLYGDFVCDVSLLPVFCFLAIPIPFYNAKSLSFGTVLYDPMSLKFFVWRFGCCFVCFWFLFVLFFWFCLFGRGSRFILHSDGLLDCVLVLRQHYFCGSSLKRWINYNV